MSNTIKLRLEDLPVNYVMEKALTEITARLREFGWEEKDIEKEAKRMVREYFKTGEVS